MKFLNLNFIPGSADAALLVLRLWLGLTMLLNHGWQKLMGFGEMAAKFSDPLGVGPTTSLVLAIFAEVICSILLALGVFTRFAALVLAITMGVAFYGVHGLKLVGQGSGELAFIYLAGFVTLFLAGGGRFGFDGRLGAKA